MKKEWRFTWRRQLSSSFFALLPSIFHHHLDQGKKSTTCFARLRGIQGLWSWHLGSVFWWLLVQASPSCLPSTCPGHLPPSLMPGLFRCTVVSHLEQLASRVSTIWRCMLYFQWKVFVMDLQLHELIWLGVSPPSFDTGAQMKYCVGLNSANLQ